MNNSLKARLKGQNDPSTSSRKFPTKTTTTKLGGGAIMGKRPKMYNNFFHALMCDRQMT